MHLIWLLLVFVWIVFAFRGRRRMTKDVCDHAETTGKQAEMWMDTQTKEGRERLRKKWGRER